MLIDYVRELVLEDGEQLASTAMGRLLIKALEENARYRELENVSIASVPVDEFIQRPEDMSATGHLSLIKQEDGDICMTVVNGSGRSAGIEFCTSGGRSPRTLIALNMLALAMIADAKDS